MRISIKLKNSLPLRRNIELARYAEVQGLHGVWISEYSDRDAVTQMASIAMSTSTIAVGASIVPIYTRSAVVLGMTLASLAELAPGRIRLGLGTSTDVIIRQWHGVDRNAPLDAMRDYVATVRAVPTGDKLQRGWRTLSHHGFRYATPTLASPAEVDVAALGPKMCRLGGEIADAVLLNLVCARDLGRIRALIAAGAADAGRVAPPLVTDVRVGISGSQDHQALTDSLRRLIASYGRAPAYNSHYARSGFSAQARLLEQAWADSAPEPALWAVDDEMLNSLVAIGSPAVVAGHLQQLAEAGLDEAILYPSFTDTDEFSVVIEAIDAAATYLRSPDGV